MVHSRKKNSKKDFIVAGLIIALIILIIIGVSLIQKNKISFPKNLGVQINGNNYYLEIAQTDQEKKIGLSNRNEICPNCGMLFIFDKDGQYPLWMKDTHIPLDMIWINSQYKIVKIITALNTDNTEIIYTNQDSARYIIELPANEVFKLNLQIGDTIQLPGISEI